MQSWINRELPEDLSKIRFRKTAFFVYNYSSRGTFNISLAANGLITSQTPRPLVLEHRGRSDWRWTDIWTGLGVSLKGPYDTRKEAIAMLPEIFENMKSQAKVLQNAEVTFMWLFMQDGFTYEAFPSPCIHVIKEYLNGKPLKLGERFADNTWIESLSNDQPFYSVYGYRKEDVDITPQDRNEATSFLNYVTNGWSSVA